MRGVRATHRNISTANADHEPTYHHLPHRRWKHVGLKAVNTEEQRKSRVLGAFCHVRERNSKREIRTEAYQMLPKMVRSNDVINPSRAERLRLRRKTHSHSLTDTTGAGTSTGPTHAQAKYLPGRTLLQKPNTGEARSCPSEYAATANPRCSVSPPSCCKSEQALQPFFLDQHEAEDVRNRYKISETGERL